MYLHMTHPNPPLYPIVRILLFYASLQIAHTLISDIFISLKGPDNVQDFQLKIKKSAICNNGLLWKRGEEPRLNFYFKKTLFAASSVIQVNDSKFDKLHFSPHTDACKQQLWDNQILKTAFEID